MKPRRSGSGSLGAKTRAEAEIKVRELDAPSVEKPATRHTWPEFKELFLESVGSELASSTKNNYGANLDAMGRFLETRKVTFVDEITLLNLEGFKLWRIEQEGVLESTVFTDYLVIRSAFRWGSKASRGIFRSDPSIDWKMKAPPAVKQPCYTRADIEALETGATPWLRPIITALAWTGVRINELCNLRWKDVNLESELIHIRCQEHWKPKGRKDRSIPMLPKVADVIRSRPVGELVFRAARGGKLHRDYVLRRLKLDLKKLGLPEENTIHGFRRHFATQMMRRGIDLKTIQQWGGWTSLVTLQRYLAELEAEDSVNSMKKVAAQLSLEKATA